MELRRFIVVLWRRLWLIVLAAVLVTGMTYALSVSSPPVYQASATIEINFGTDPRSDAYSSLLVSERSAKTYVEQLRSPKLARDVGDALGLNLSPGRLLGMARPEQVRDTQLIRIVAESSNPELAQQVANKWTELFIVQTAAKQQARYLSAKLDLDAQIADLEKQISDAQKSIAALGDPRDPRNANIPEFARVERTGYESTLSSLSTRYVILLKSAEDFRLASARQSDTITVFAPAETPRVPIRPQVMLNTLLGLVSGLILGVATAFLLEYLDDTVKDPDQIATTLGLTALGSVTKVRGLKHSREALVTANAGKSPTAEAYRILRTNFQFTELTNPHPCAVVTSSGPREGKTTTLANLGVVLAQAGKRVILVDTDLRRPALHKLFGVSRELGVTSLLLNPETKLDEVLLPTGIEGLRVLPSGPIPPNPAEILASPKMGQLIQTLQGEADIVLFDSPPVLSVADATLLASRIGSLVLVVAAGETRMAALTQAKAALDRASARILGVVLNKVDVGRSGYYYYYYRYYHYYGNESSNGNGRQRKEKGKRVEQRVDR